MPRNTPKIISRLFLATMGTITFPQGPAKPLTPDTFLGYIVESRKRMRLKPERALNLTIWQCPGFLALLRRTLPNEAEALPRTKTTLHQAVMQNGCFSAFQKLIWQLLNPVNTLDEHKWTACMKEFLFLFRFSKPSARGFELPRMGEVRRRNARKRGKIRDPN